VTPFGADLDAFWSGLVTGSDGISTIERFPVDDLRVGRGGEIKKLRPLPGARRVGCRATQLLFAAAEDLLARSAISAEPERIAVVLGTALGGVEELERALAPEDVCGTRWTLYDSPAHALARRLGARGPVTPGRGVRPARRSARARDLLRSAVDVMTPAATMPRRSGCAASTRCAAHARARAAVRQATQRLCWARRPRRADDPRGRDAGTAPGKTAGARERQRRLAHRRA
jgi:hypothetical protein